MENLKKDAIADKTRARIKQAKKEMGLKYTQLAREIDLNTITLYNFLSNKQALPFERLININEYIDKIEQQFNDLYNKCI